MSHRILWKTTQPCSYHCFFCLPHSSLFPGRKITESSCVLFPWLHTQLPSSCRWCHPRGKLSNSRKVAANWKDRAGIATVPWAQGGLRGGSRILSCCHCCCTRKATSLFLTLNLSIDFSVNRSREMFRIKPNQPCCNTLCFFNIENKSKERSLQRKYQKTVKPSFTKILKRRKLITLNIKNYF